MNMKMIVAIVVVVLLLVGGFAAYTYFTGREKPEIRIEYAVGDNFITNTTDGRFLRTMPVLVINTDDEKMITLLDNSKGMIRDSIIRIQRNYNGDQLEAEDAMDIVRNDFIAELNARFEFASPVIVDIVFYDFVLQ